MVSNCIYLLCSEFVTLAQCHGVQMQAYRAPVDSSDGSDNNNNSNNSNSGTHISLINEVPPTEPDAYLNMNLHSAKSLKQFEKLIERTCTSEKAEAFVIANFSRKTLDQTGDGHFSPIGTSFTSSMYVQF